MKNKILVFIPMYNCEKQIIRVLKQFNKGICAYIHEIIIVDNRSTDNGEGAVIQFLKTNKLPCKVSFLKNEENYGLGGSHKVAFKYAIENKFDYVIVLHGDDQGSIENLIPYIENGEYSKYDSLLGARFMPGSELKGYSRIRTFGNVVYNLLFSIGCGKRIYDLGSGLNMYKVEKLKSVFYIKYKDNLIFNYCMIMGASYYKQNIKFFPISWREDDQISNVKIFSQALTVIKLLVDFVRDKEKFMQNEHRNRIISDYKAKVIHTSIPS